MAGAGALPGVAGARALAPNFGFGSGSASIEGVVEGPGGKPVQNANVRAEQPGLAWELSTNVNGEYRIAGIPGGEYTVEFSDSAQNLATQFYDARPTKEQADRIVLLEGATAAGVDATLKQGATIAGTVTSASTHAAIGEAYACAKPLGGSEEHCARTTAAGEYAIEHLEAGQYTISFLAEGQGYLRQFYDGKGSASEAQAVTATAGATTSGIDAALLTGGGIVGTVVEARSGNALQGIEVCATPLGASPWQGTCTHTEPGGGYAIRSLTSGEYTVVFHGTGDLLTQYYKLRGLAGEAEAVRVTDGAATEGIDAKLARGGEISGRVSDATSGKPLAEVEACARPSGSGSEGRVCTGTNAAGDYTIEGLTTGSYVVSYEPWQKNYFYRYYGGAGAESEAQAVAVVAESTAAGIDVGLEPGAEISGVVTELGTGHPLAGAEVCARSLGLFSFGSECSQSGGDGRYSIIRLQTGAYDVSFSDKGYAPQYYAEATGSQEAEPAIAISGESTPGIDAALVPGASISGRVTSAAGATPVTGVSVCANPVGAEGGGCATTGAGGEYTVGGLGAGHYRVSFSGGGYPAQYYGGVYSASEASSVPLGAGQAVEHIDIALHGGGSISGSIHAAQGGAAIEGGRVCVRAPRGPSSCGSSGTGGAYVISGLVPGAYRVTFEAAPGYLETALPHSVAVAAEQVTAGVNATLTWGGGISGTVSEAATGHPLAGVTVCPALVESSFEPIGFGSYCVTTGADGTYRLEGLAEGEWGVQFSKPAFALQIFREAASPEEATPVDVKLGAVTAGVDAALGVGGEISGEVTGPAGEPLDGAQACAVPAASPDGSPSVCATADSAGNFTIAALGAGRYALQFSDYGKHLIAQYSGGAYWRVQASTVKVLAGGNTTAADAQLHGGGSLSGTVRSEATGAPLPAIEVCVSRRAPEGEISPALPACVFTGAGGAYALSELAPGEYEISFSSLTHKFAAANLSARVSAERATSSIDAMLVPGGGIGGRVTDEGGEALSGLEVCAIHAAVTIACSQTNQTGSFKIAGLEPGSYVVRFERPGSPFEPGPDLAPQYYPGGALPAEATPVTVTGGTVTGEINARMSPGAVIAGRVSAAAGGEPVAEDFVCAVTRPAGESAQSQSYCSFADESGRYEIAGLARGSYVVHAAGSAGLAPHFYGGATLAGATPISAVPGETFAGKDIALPAGARIKGRVTSTEGGRPIRGVDVCAIEAEGEGSCGTTYSNGTYSIAGLAAGSYTVEFDDRGRYLTQYYDRVSSAAAATPVELSTGAVDESIDAELSPVSPVEPESPHGEGGGAPHGGETTGEAPSSSSSSSGAPAAASRPSTEVRGYTTALRAPVLAGRIAPRAGGVVVPLGCVSGSCLPGKVTLTVLETLSHGRVTGVAAGRVSHGRRTRRVVVGMATATPAAGRTDLVVVRLDATGRRLLGRWRPLPVGVAVTSGVKLLAEVHLRIR
ncbi:MAG TPA: carboxypeptidase regulatory-like domain-containing protein [Solirubrobacteraceae bacterium]|nr:carboxypeptidase regulatory-like domain-containing protein [Solirubrobacteraceae bacterium]